MTINTVIILILIIIILAGFFYCLYIKNYQRCLDTQAKERLNKLIESHLFLESTLDSIDDIFYAFDLNGKFIKWNKACNRVTGYSDQELSTMNPGDIFSEEDSKAARESIEDIFKDKILKKTFKLISKGGKQFYYEFTNSILKGSKGDIIGFTGVGRDITAHIELEEKYKAIMENSIDQIFIVDKEFKLISANRIVLWLFQKSNNEIIEKHILETFPNMIAENSMQNIEKVFKTGESVFFEETIIIGKDKYFINYSFNPIKNNKGKVVSVLGIGRDISQLKKIEQKLILYNKTLEERVMKRTEELNKNKEKLIDLLEKHIKMEDILRVSKELAESGNRAKSEFVANISHEFRTPLNSILGFAQILEAEYYGAVTDKQKEYIKDILEAGEHLLTLINDILDISKIEAGSMDLNFSEIDIRLLINNAMILLRQKAIAHNIKYEQRIYPDVPDKIIGDERKIKQVLYNLLSNAFKFTQEGGEVIIEAKLRKFNKEKGVLPLGGDCIARAIDGSEAVQQSRSVYNNEMEISVIDTGIGINPENLQKLFMPFVQFDTLKPGTGLGLHLCKKMVNLWGGKINVISPLNEKEKGCRFYFTIPIKL